MQKQLYATTVNNKQIEQTFSSIEKAKPYIEQYILEKIQDGCPDVQFDIQIYELEEEYGELLYHPIESYEIIVK